MGMVVVMRVRVIMRLGHSMVVLRVGCVIVSVVMVMRHCIVMMVPTHAVLHRKFPVFAAIAGHA
jgi:hypothetical protein